MDRPVISPSSDHRAHLGTDGGGVRAGRRRRRTNLVVGLVAALSAQSILTAIPSAAAAPFDDTAGNTHEAMIEVVADLGITTGCTPDGRSYCPTRLVTREQMASFIVRALQSGNVTVPSNPPRAFPDIAGSVHARNIDTLAAMGVVFGRSDGTYGPGEPVNRGQMALFISRAWQLPPATGGNVFRDVPALYRTAANSMAEQGITLGCDASGTRYCPGDPVRRDQMASFLGRTVTRGADVGAGDPGAGRPPTTTEPTPGTIPPGPTGPPPPIPNATASSASDAVARTADHLNNEKGDISCAVRWFGLSGPAFNTPEPTYYYWQSEIFVWTGQGWRSVAYGRPMWKQGGSRGWYDYRTSEMSNLQQWTTQGGYFTSLDHVWSSPNEGRTWSYVGPFLPRDRASQNYWCAT